MATRKKNSQKDRPKQKRVVLAAKDLPRKSLPEVIPVAQALHDTYAGKAASFDDLARALGLGKSSNNTKYLIWSAEAYGLTKKAEDGTYSLAEPGRKIVAPTYDGEALEGLRQAVLTPTILSKFFSDYDGHPLPGEAHLPNVLETKFKVPRERVPEAIEILNANARTAAVVEESDGKLVVRLEGAVAPADDGETGLGEDSEADAPADPTEDSTHESVTSSVDWSTTCFFVAPIGPDDSDVRRHSDMMLRHLVSPAAADHGLSVVRADQIGKSGLITQQILEYLTRARLCVADLSFGNPNAFYELAVRHVFGLPTVQVTRRQDKIPFDVSQGRTIVVDTSDVYTIMDRFESARRELGEHVAAALSSSKEAESDNPIGVYLPGIIVTLPK